MYIICVKQDILVGSKVTFLQVQKCRGMEISTFNACLGQGKNITCPNDNFSCPIIQRGMEEVTCPGQVSIKKAIDKLDIAFCAALTFTRKNTNFSQSFLLQTP